MKMPLQFQNFLRPIQSENFGDQTQSGGHAGFPSSACISTEQGYECQSLHRHIGEPEYECRYPPHRHISSHKFWVLDNVCRAVPQEPPEAPLGLSIDPLFGFRPCLTMMGYFCRLSPARTKSHLNETLIINLLTLTLIRPIRSKSAFVLVGRSFFVRVLLIFSNLDPSVPEGWTGAATVVGSIA